MVTIGDSRITELQGALPIALQAGDRVKTMMRDLASVNEALERACDSIYNVSFYDPATEKPSA